MFHHVRPARTRGFQPNAHLEITPDFLEFVVKRTREKGYDIVHLDEAIDLLKAGHARKRYAVLTFDDGYRDNLEIVYPMLRRMDAPFTVFATSGLIDRTSELWWAALEQVIDGAQTLTFSHAGIRMDFPCRSLAEKQACFLGLVNRLTLEIPEEDQRGIIRLLCERYGVDLDALADQLMMTWDELRALSREPLVTIGAHTHDHLALARLSEERAKADITRGMERLETELGARPRHFAYPYGKEDAVSDRDAAFLASIGFASAVTTSPGVLTSACARDLMRLPRVSINGQFQTAEYFEQYLTGVPFALFGAARWVASGFGIRSRVSRPAPSTR
ncbi:polysaccharide deacetylase family protein [Roseibium aquae]|nr:polysaccharide deacetylase family protein [Roseibium aquae]